MELQNAIKNSRIKKSKRKMLFYKSKIKQKKLLLRIQIF